MTQCDRPLAAPGLTSYRCKGRYGWIMIGARDDADALNEARRSSDSATAAGLEVWTGAAYGPSQAQIDAARDAGRGAYLRDVGIHGPTLRKIPRGFTRKPSRA